MTSFGQGLQNDIPTVLLSVLVAVLATYSALDLAGRVHGAVDAISARLWVGAGSVALGSGIWAMHFVGLSAAELPFTTQYEVSASALSWLAAVVLSGIVLWATGRTRLRWPSVAALAVLCGVGATTMHFIGMSALVVTPVVAIDSTWVAAAVVTATVGSGIAMSLFAGLRQARGTRGVAGRVVTATVFGSSLAAMHFLSMMAMTFADGTLCLTTNGLDAEALGHPLAAAATVFLLLTLTITALERRAALRAVQLDGSLERTRRELEYVTLTDEVTGLPNRSVFQDRMGQAFQRSARTGLSVAVLAIEIDDFEQLLQRLDDTALKKLMRAAGVDLSATLRASDTLASAGQHRFLALVDDLKDAEPARRVAESMRLALGQLISSDADLPALTISIGIAVFPADGPASRSVGNATAALGMAQRQGGNNTKFFEAYLDSAARVQSEWVRDLKLALERSEFQLHYQPKVTTSSGRLAGAEALLRWTHPVRGSVSPAEFIPIAEQAGLMKQIGAWVLEEACRQMGCWLEDGLEVHVAVNLSAQQLQDVELPRKILDALQRHGVPTHLLTCEVTETTAMDDTEVTTAVLAQLMRHGIYLSIDDFGTGFSSLSYLRKLPVRQLKIDRSFVNDLAESADAQAIAKGIIELAHALRLEVVAEGVETTDQRAILQSLGCDTLQGYFFSQALASSGVRRVGGEKRDTFGAAAGTRPTASGLIVTATVRTSA